MQQKVYLLQVCTKIFLIKYRLVSSGFLDQFPKSPREQLFHVSLGAKKKPSLHWGSLAGLERPRTQDLTLTLPKQTTSARKFFFLGVLRKGHALCVKFFQTNWAMEAATAHIGWYQLIMKHLSKANNGSTNPTNRVYFTGKSNQIPADSFPKIQKMTRWYCQGGWLWRVSVSEWVSEWVSE